MTAGTEKGDPVVSLKIIDPRTLGDLEELIAKARALGFPIESAVDVEHPYGQSAHIAVRNWLARLPRKTAAR